MRNDEIWDEFQWEEFMKEQDKKVDRFMELFYKFHDHPNRNELIAREMGWTWLLDQSARSPEPPESIEEEGEEWKSLSGIEASPDADCEYDPVYLKAKEFALRAYRYADHLSESVREDSVVVDFIANAMIASAKIAGGSSMGNGIDELGGNIAYCKRGLAAANLAIAALREMKERKIIDAGASRDLQEEAVEVRNAIALHIINLREKFRFGIS